MLTKESKIRVLENFHAIDYVFFGKNIKEMESCCPLVKEEYLSIKGALLSVYIEMLKLIDHQPAVLENALYSDELIEEAKTSALIARENAEQIVTSTKSRQNIKESLKERFKEDQNTNLNEALKEEIRQKAFSLAIDNLLLSRTLEESTEVDNLNEWEGVIIEDSYKILRTNLIEAATEVLESLDEADLKSTKAPVFGVGSLAAAAVGTVAVRRMMIKRRCKKRFPDDHGKYIDCLRASRGAEPKYNK